MACTVTTSSRTDEDKNRTQLHLQEKKQQNEHIASVINMTNKIINPWIIKQGT